MDKKPMEFFIGPKSLLDMTPEQRAILALERDMLILEREGFIQAQENANQSAADVIMEGLIKRRIFKRRIYELVAKLKESAPMYYKHADPLAVVEIIKQKIDVLELDPYYT